MANSTVLYLLGWALVGLALLMGLTAVAALAFGEGSQAALLFLNMCVTGFVAGALVIGFHGRIERMGRPHTLLLVLLLWFVVPLFGAAPFLSFEAYGTPTRAIFETVSGLTTTGASVLGGDVTLPGSLALWRSLLQWFGGALTLLTAVIVLAPFGVLSTPINITIPGYERDDLARSVVATARHILPAYGLLTLVCMVALWLVGIPPFDAVCLALSTVSTGGFVPSAGGIQAYDSVLAELILMVFMLAGATSFLAHRAVLMRVAGTHFDNKETWYLLFLVLLGAGIICAVSGLPGDVPEPPALERIRYGFFRAVSMITTTGFDNAPSDAPGVPFVLVCTAIAIGGASFSTAGGLKVFRAFSMLAQAHRELKRLIHPRSVTRAQSTGKPLDVQIMKTIWSTFFLFVFSVSVVSVVLAVEGVTFDTAVISSMAVLTNSGPVIDAALFDGGEQARIGFGEMRAPSLWALMVGMVLGRIEFAAVLSLAMLVILRR